MKKKLIEGLKHWDIECTDAQLDKLIVYLDELLRWNKKINLTAISDPLSAVEKHLVDSLLLLKYLGNEECLLDLGSGGGLPSIPLSIVRPELEIISVDSVGKKINFQKHIKRLLKLDKFIPVHIRTEQLADNKDYQNCFDVVTARAFTSLKELLEMSAPFLKPCGLLLALKGPEIENELEAAREILETGRYTSVDVDKYRLPYSQGTRTVVKVTYQTKI